MREALLASLLLASSSSSSSSSSSTGTSLPDDLPFDHVLFAGTHNSAINLGAHTVGRPAAAVGGRWPSAAASAYQYPVMDQRLSVRDQLEQGIRFIDLEIAAIGNYSCSAALQRSCESIPRCQQHQTHGEGLCFSCCPFIVSHGSVQESVGDTLGYTYPEDIFTGIAKFASENPTEVIGLMLITSHGNHWPDSSAIRARLNSSRLLPFVWNPNPEPALSRFPTLGEMRASGRTVMLVGMSPSIWPSSPGVTSSHVNSSEITQPGETCTNDTPCMEGWDAVTFAQQAPDRAILGKGQMPPVNTSLFLLENLSSRRGRSNTSAEYWPLPNLLVDAPYLAGGNPDQAALAARYDHIVALEAAWSTLLQPFESSANVVLVDFFNTTVPRPGMPSRTLLPNPHDGLVRAVHDINAARVQRRQIANE
jgi:hypothetical protein